MSCFTCDPNSSTVSWQLRPRESFGAVAVSIEVFVLLPIHLNLAFFMETGTIESWNLIDSGNEFVKRLYFVWSRHLTAYQHHNVIQCQKKRKKFWFCFVYLFNGVSTPYRLFNTKIWFIPKFLTVIEKKKKKKKKKKFWLVRWLNEIVVVVVVISSSS